MFPKPQKNNQKFSTTNEQLDFVESISRSDRQHNKRLLIAIVLFLSLFSSLGFALYGRHIKGQPLINLNVKLNLPSLPARNTPRLTIKLPPPPSDITLSLAIVDYGQNPIKVIYQTENWSRLGVNLSNDFSSLLTSASASVGDMASRLPSGLQVTGHIIDYPDSLTRHLFITSPRRQLLISFKAIGPGTSLLGYRSQLPGFVEEIYWQVVNQ